MTFTISEQTLLTIYIISGSITTLLLYIIIGSLVSAIVSKTELGNDPPNIFLSGLFWPIFVPFILIVIITNKFTTSLYKLFGGK